MYMGPVPLQLRNAIVAHRTDPTRYLSNWQRKAQSIINIGGLNVIGLKVMRLTCILSLLLRTLRAVNARACDNTIKVCAQSRIHIVVDPEMSLKHT